MPGYESVLERLEEEGLVDVTRDDRVQARCPAHNDARASLSLKEGDDGRALVYCHAGCPTSDVVAALDLRMSDLFTASEGGVVVDTYTYTDEEGRPLVRVTRTDPKGFWQERWEDGGWVAKLGDVRRVLYRLPEVLAAVAEGRVVYFVEGEKDVDNLEAAFDVTATTMLGGSGKWREEYGAGLAGARVVLIPDADDAGHLGASRVQEGLRRAGASVDVLLPGRGKDATDHILAGLGLDDLLPSGDDVVFEPIEWWSYVPPSDEWLFKPYVPKGARVLVHGPSGALKSLWAMWLAAKLALEGKNVAYFSTEMPKGATVKRMRRLNPPKNMRLYGRFMLGQDLETAIKNFEGYDLLVIDSWSSARGDVSSNDNDAISDLDRDFFQPLIEATGATLMLLDNTGKDAVTDKGEKVRQTMARGASRKRDIQEVELWFSRPVPGNNFRTTVECTKMRLDIPAPAAVTIETPQDRIEFYIVAQGGMTTEPMWPDLRVVADAGSSASPTTPAPSGDVSNLDEYRAIRDRKRAERDAASETE